MNEPDARLMVIEAMLRQSLRRGRMAVHPEVRAFAGQFPVTATYFLFDVEPDGGVEIFITYTLGRLIQQLSRSNLKRPVELDGEVRGRVLWPATYKARYADGYNPTRFVCGEVIQNYDTPENQLLKFMMEVALTCLRAVPPLIRQGRCYLPEESEKRLSVQSAIRLGRMESALQLARRNKRMQAVTLPQVISEVHLMRAETAMMEEYAGIARLYRHYRNVVLNPSWESISAVGRRVLPLPSRLGGQAGDWVRLAATLQAVR